MRWLEIDADDKDALVYIIVLALGMFVGSMLTMLERGENSRVCCRRF